MIKLSPIEKEIVALFYTGKSPSQIDRQLDLAEGRSHDVVIAHWYDDKMRNSGR